MSPTSNRSRNRQQGKPEFKGNRNSAGQVRIIAGQWRGRKLAVANVAGLRPTGDRVRETLFNWLQADIAGSHCLDLFAGSGALGFEAVSRFAASSTFVEPDSQAFRILQSSVSELGLVGDERVQLVQSTAQRFLLDNRKAFDIVFIDPPFGEFLQWDTVTALITDHLAPSALIYVESPSDQPAPEQWPEGLHLHKEKQFGDVHARLLAKIGQN
ncbi:16S rRNA (guanine(966)-N(2))-methyltransferase RsmD [Granulosicoccus antarcticus]|uniref:16S rRNA (guanine(966)-N(2))-methyltransferase RsmD n=1 Tax=Granulosicoccus antarcticus TaxID=437505 RepID=UPI00197A9FD6|nr:16S rRNA (guanine(966)-N(2))-methyltransferase RsmD [Granulosicoccus antarcticus]